MRRLHLKDHRAEQRLFARRAAFAAALAALAIGAVAARLVQLQVLEHRRYSTLSHENRVRLVPLPPPRGLIFDRNGT
ncbi:MAG TPA: penicillin-binding protein 2, partial [Chromatiales bacterium]|nr:penicillin-binding protein 2 [Chromatiales bacterium]